MEIKRDGRPCHESFGKRVLLQLVGGSLDGRVLDSNDPKEAPAVLQLCVLTNGEVGKAIEGVSLEHTLQVQQSYLNNSPMPEVPMMPRGVHAYQVVDRQEDDDVIRLRVQYRALSNEVRERRNSGR